MRRNVVTYTDMVGTERRTVREALDVAEKTYFEGEQLTPDDIGISDVTDVDEAVGLWRAADRQLAAARRIKKAAGEQLAALLGDGGVAMIGDTVVRYKQGRKERCIDPDGLAAYTMNELAERRVRLSDVANPAYLKRSWMVPAVRDTFFEWVDDDGPSLSETPRGKAPKFLQDLVDGDVIVKETGDE